MDATESESTHSKLRERSAEWARRESIEARASEWRGRSEAERSAAFVGLMRMAVYIAQHRPVPYVKPPLAFPRFSSVGNPNERATP